ncbi:unnamed protein product [Paramecium sonneborni]|uniref:Uncharacterized protein n=1 Tax=Paramecium sonneborni TaxID=65129 RepID=A0A8S1L708_9CILI|nr:unnamed protein product [Paramecium sonneborni]
MQNENDETGKIVKVIKRRLSQIWILVIINILGSFVSFVQNIYFVLMNEILRNNPERYTCYYVKIEDNPNLTNVLNTTLELSEKLLSFFLPYFAALIIFWPKKTIIQNSENKQDNTDIVIETYIIHNTEVSDTSLSKE